jgi:transposase
MFTVVWNPLGFHVIDKLPTGARMNRECFTINVLARLEKEIFPEGRTAHAQRLITVYMNNCSIHTSGATEDCMKQNNMLRVRYQPYSPGLVPCDFYLFPSVKEELKKIRMFDEDD